MPSVTAELIEKFTYLLAVLVTYLFPLVSGASKREYNYDLSSTIF